MLHLSRAETTEPINTNFWTIDYLGDIKGIWWPWVLGELLLKWVKYTLFCMQFACTQILGSLIRLQTTICNGFWCTVAQKIRFGARMCLLSIQSVNIQCKGVKLAKIWLSREIPAKSKTPENSNGKLTLHKTKHTHILKRTTEPVDTSTREE